MVKIVALWLNSKTIKNSSTKKSLNQIQDQKLRSYAHPGPARENQ